MELVSIVLHALLQIIRPYCQTCKHLSENSNLHSFFLLTIMAVISMKVTIVQQVIVGNRRWHRSQKLEK